MLANRGRDTLPELAVRSGLHRRGLRYRVNARPEPALRRTADLVFVGARVAVFIDGCFWHGCPQHATRPQKNAEWWAAKLDRNKERDTDTSRQLEQSGGGVVGFWEHEPTDKVLDPGEHQVRPRQPAGVGRGSPKPRRRRG